ncbi:hypothetical protein [Nocardia sp. NPDC050793]
MTTLRALPGPVVTITLFAEEGGTLVTMTELTDAHNSPALLPELEMG